MSTIEVDAIEFERRFHSRYGVKTQVYIHPEGRERIRCTAKNLSAEGVFIETRGLGLRIGEVVELTFVIRLDKTVKMHRRHARVIHIRAGGTGFQMRTVASARDHNGSSASSGKSAPLK